MAVTPVSLGLHLRAWALSGLTHLLCDGPVGFAEERTDILPADEADDDTSRMKTERRTLTGESPARQTTHTQYEQAAMPSQAASSALSGGTAPSNGFILRKGGASDPATWPEAWRTWYGKISPAPILWTYHELGADVTGIGRSTTRSAFFKQLITDLRLPKGSSVFWPCAMPVGADGPLQADASIFASGVQCLRPQVIVVFGEAALQDIGLDGRLKPFRQVIVEGKLVLLVPEIDTLLHEQKQRESTASLLRAVLASNIPT